MDQGEIRTEGLDQGEIWTEGLDQGEMRMEGMDQGEMRREGLDQAEIRTEMLDQGEIWTGGLDKDEIITDQGWIRKRWEQIRVRKGLKGGIRMMNILPLKTDSLHCRLNTLLNCSRSSNSNLL